MPSPLAVTTITNVPPDRYERIQQAAEKQLGAALTGTSGTVSHDGAVIEYSYDGKNLLTISVLKTPKVLWHQVSPQAIMGDIEKAINAIA